MATKTAQAGPAERARLAQLPRAVIRAKLEELAVTLRELQVLIGNGLEEEVSAGPVRLRLTVTVGPAPGPGCKR